MNRRYLYIAFVAALLAGCSKKDSPAEVNAAKPSEPPVVKVVSAETRKVEKSISVTGSLMPEETVTVSAEVGGRIAAIHYDFGQFVKQGAVIAEIDKQEYQIAYDRAKAALAQALARIGLDPS